MENPHDLPPGAPLPDELMPPSRPTWRIFLGAVVVLIGVAAIMNGHAVAQFLGF